ncbi:MAG: integrin alpha [Myxococcota bacterium]
MGRMSLLGVLLPLSACAFISDEHESWRLDPDEDGLIQGDDCDNQDASVGGPLTWNRDLDGDGFGDPNNTVEACAPPENTVTNASDCWDDPDNIPDAFVALNGLPQPAAADVFPGADNALYDGVNQSCAAEEDFNDFDGDGDGFLTAFYADRGGAVGDDCVDGAPLDADNPAGLSPARVNPNASETWYDGTDADCDGNDCDADGDGYDGGLGSVYCVVVDCDDVDPTIRPDPSVDEVFFNGIDDNCDISVGDGDGDEDGDGFWSARYEEQVVANSAEPLPIPDGFAGDCWDDTAAIPDDYVAINGFAQPTAADVNPGAAEVWYDAVDQDCAADLDFDADGDGFQTDTQPDRRGQLGDDCVDDNAAINPGAIEIFYDGTDDNCDGNDDDQDLDGFAGVDGGGDDCDDLDRSVNPSAFEIIADEIDQNCDGQEICRVDVDEDGYWPDDLTVMSTDEDCSDPGEATASAPSGDCDDRSDAAFPGADVVCADGVVDNDCDGELDLECLIDEEIDVDDKGAVTLQMYGDRESAYAGSAVAFGELDSTEGADAILGAFGDDAVYVFSGVTTGAVTLSDADASISSESAETFGRSVLSGLDLDGDGSDDLVVGAINGQDAISDVTVGVAYVFYGPLTSALSTSDADMILAGVEANGDLSFAMAGVEESGAVELLLGAPGVNYLGDAANAGVAYLVSGALTGSQTLDEDTYTARFYGKEVQMRVGFAVSSAGDLDGDGEEDLLIGAPLQRSASSTDDGAAYVVYGPVSGDRSIADADVQFVGTTSSDLGYGLASAGDIDGDGLDDCWITAPSHNGSARTAGAVFAVFGDDEDELESGDIAERAGAVIVGDRRGQRFGSSVAAAGDVDGDGTVDVLVGASSDDGVGSNSGAAYLVYGPISGMRSVSDDRAVIYGAETSEQLGYGVASGADADGDDVNDLLIGTFGPSYEASLGGAAYLILGQNY